MGGEGQNRNGFVSLIGAGPGDPGLLTLKGMERLRQAEVVVYDYLANQRLLEFVPAGAERINAGKEGGQHILEQEEITTLLLDRALRGKRVVRLKGGDPFIFGRGGEEAEALAAAGIPFEVVPGVTSAIAVPTYAGIPLSHRRYTPIIAFITGHEGASRSGSRIPWKEMASSKGTLVFLMAYGNLPSITHRLMHEGRDPKTPVALVRWGTLPSQRTIVGTLADIVQRAEEAHFGPPVIIVVGEVVRLRAALNWFEGKPLFGRRILVTRAREQASVLSRLLEAEGAEAIEFPVIQIEDPPDYRGLDRAISQIQDYHWILFTSVHGVRYFWDRLRAAGKDGRALSGVRLGAMGPATASALRGRGLEPDLIPSEFLAESFLEGMGREPLQGKRILLPRAARARELLPRGLREQGARVAIVTAYRTTKPEADFKAIRERLKQGEIDVVTFTSSSTVHYLMEGLGKRGAPALQHTLIASIGPITSATAAEYGLKVSIQAQEYTIPGLVRAICQFLQRDEERI